MNFVLSVLAWSVVTGAVPLIDGDPNPGSFWLSRIQVNGDELTLTRTDQDQGFSIEVDDKPARPCPAKSVWHLPIYHCIRLVGPESSFVLRPIDSKGRELFIAEETNRRGDIHVALLIRSPSSDSKLIVGDVSYVGVIPHAENVTSREELNVLEAILLK